MNARGLRNNTKRKALFLFAKQFRTDLVYLQESHSVPNDTNYWKSQWGSCAWFSHGTEHSAGVTTLKNRLDGDVLFTECDPAGHFVCQAIRYNDQVYIISNVYGYNTRKDNDNLFISIENILLSWLTKFPKATILLGGDFNIILNSTMDKWPPDLLNRTNTDLIAFMDKFNLEDIWRIKNPNNRTFTWSNKAGSSQSRLDFWLISKGFNKNNIEVDIHPTPLTDHKAIYIKINLSTSQFCTTRSVFWKLNRTLLSIEAVKKDVTDLISYFWSKAKKEKQFCTNWELMKFELGKFFRKFSGNLAKSKRAEELNVVSRITHLSWKTPDALSEEEKLELSNLQIKLDELYNQKAKGAFVRSRVRWLEEGEQNSHYFFNLEKHHCKVNNLNKLNIDGVLTKDYNTISSYCSHFYTKLYSSRFCQASADAFLNSLKVKTITGEEMEMCDNPVSLGEVKDAINLLKNNKSPGTDGLVSEFYKSFAEELAPFLFNVFLESIDREQLPTTMTQGLTTLIPKANKDTSFIDNWRPISLLNNDYKIFALIFARRLKKVLDSIIDETQSGFMSKRHITNNIRLVIDILDYSEILDDNGFILFLDFYKAFDTVEHQFILQSLNKFGFGNYFSSAIKTLYKNSNSSIKLPGGTSPRFHLSRGIRQGCPASPYLFLIVAQLMAYHIKASAVEGISLFGKDLIITQLADDTTLFLKNETQIPVAIKVIQEFSRASGLCLNIKKCELMAIKNCAKSELHNIPIKDEVQYLGILVTKDQNTRSTSNLNPIIQKTRRKLNQWLLRDLSLRGRILLTKAEGISRLTYAALALHLSDKTIKEIDKMLFDFVWKNRTHYLKKTVITNSYENGGLNFLDFKTLNNTFKINWLKQLFQNPTSIWNIIPFHILSKLGGTDFFLVCNYDIDKIPVKMSAFHRQAFLSWSLIYKHNFSPHSYLIWNNKDILYKHKSLFKEYWFQNNIIWVDQLFNKDGLLFTYKEFLAKYNIPVAPGEYAEVFGAIPSGVCMLFRNQKRLDVHKLTCISPTDTLTGKLCLSSHSVNNNRCIKIMFQRDVATLPCVVPYWNRFVDDIPWKKVWLLANRYLITNKVKEISFKLIHKFYPAKTYIKNRFKKDIDINCSFCDEYPETVVHLFWCCPPVKFFWQKLCDFIHINIKKQSVLAWKNVLFGLSESDIQNSNSVYLINLLILMSKYHIHCCKYSGKKPCFTAFYNEFRQYILSIKHSEKQKALKTVAICTIFNVFI